MPEEPVRPEDPCDVCIIGIATLEATVKARGFDYLQKQVNYFLCIYILHSLTLSAFVLTPAVGLTAKTPANRKHD